MMMNQAKKIKVIKEKINLMFNQIIKGEKIGKMIKIVQQLNILIMIPNIFVILILIRVSLV